MARTKTLRASMAGRVARRGVLAERSQYLGVEGILWQFWRRGVACCHAGLATTHMGERRAAAVYHAARTPLVSGSCTASFRMLNSGMPNEGGFMPRALAESGRVELRLRAEDKATLTRAASLKRLDLTGYILRAVLPQAQADIAEAERVALSSRDSLSVLALLENPPPAPDRLARAAKAGFILP
jgi:uncharacterized protein (DUF1778 family)